MIKSNLFELLVSRCKSSEEKEQKNISANRFFIEVLRVLSQSDDVNARAINMDESTRQEFAALRKLFAQFNVDYVQCIRDMEKYLSGTKENFFDGYLFSKLMTEYEVKHIATEDGAFCVTADKVCGRLLAEPTEAIANILFRTEKDGEKDGEQYTFTIDMPFDDDGNEADGASRGKEEDDRKHFLSKLLKRVDDMQKILFDTIFGQDHAIKTFVSGYFQAELSALTQTNRDKPRAMFLFAGPPGTGKTFLSEQAAKALGLPFMRFDMSEYSDKEANLEFCGSDKVYKNGSEGNVTGFVAKNPSCVLLFDEIEKAHLNVIHLFLQILDAGRIRDNFTDEEVSFTDTIIIFTTNAGKGMYEDESVNLQTVSRKSVLRALSAEVSPVTGSPLFPAAICSRFASGNVVMFNRMEAGNLVRISQREIQKQFDGVANSTNISITYDDKLPYAIIFSEGGNADARTIRGRSRNFVYDEIYELFRLLNSESNQFQVELLRSVQFELQTFTDPAISSLFLRESSVGVLVFANRERAELCKQYLADFNLHCTDDLNEAKTILEKQDIDLILCDITCGQVRGAAVLNIEDVDSEGRDFFYYATERLNIPVYILTENLDDISREEWLSLSNSGARDRIYLCGGKQYDMNAVLSVEANRLAQQKNLLQLAKANKVLRFKTLQKVSADGADAKIVLYDFRLETAVDAEDSKHIVDDISKPNVCFDDVIGAKDAKEELSYFIDYLKTPGKFLHRGVKPPKGILLYGPPGTGKTLLAKALAGESDVTFIKAEGNQFLKRFVGEGAESVHALFQTARKYAPAILFIDEIDAIAKVRGSNASGYNADDVLTSFLTEMDGFNSDGKKTVFVLAATNYEVEQGTARSLDAALLRRFDRRIYVDLPDKEERIQFINRKVAGLASHALSEEQIENIAVRSTGSSLADLDSVFEMALRDVIKSKDLTLTDDILENAFETFTNGDVKKWAEAELLRTARHEAGHALMCWHGGEKPSYLTVVARGSHGGYMQHGDSENKGNYTRNELLAKVRTALGGRAAEVVYYGEEDGKSTGASGDLLTATRLIQSMLCDYGMDDEIGLAAIRLSEIVGSEYHTQIMRKTAEILSEQFRAAKEILTKNKAAIDALVEALLVKNALKESEIDSILQKTAVI